MNNVDWRIEQRDNKNWRDSYLPVELFDDVRAILDQLKIRTPILSLPEIEREIEGFHMIVSCAHSVIQDYRQRSETKPPITFCIVDEREAINAFATMLPNGSYCIVITFSIFSFLLNVSEAFLSRPPLQKLFALKKNLKRFINDTRKAGTPIVRSHRSITYKSAAKFASIGLHMTIFMAVLYHELGHIVNGHLGLIRTGCNGLSRIQLLQVLEFDADCTMVVEMLQQIGRGNLVPASAGLFSRTAIDRNRLGLLAAHLMFRARAEENDPGNNWFLLKAHMPPEHRSIFIRYAVCNLLEKTQGLTAEFIEESILNPVIYAVELSAIQLTRSTKTQSRYNDSFEGVAAVQNDLLRRWHIVRPQLEPHKLGSHALAQIQDV